MKKAALVLFIFFIVLVGTVQAEPYKGTNFPSDQQIAKSVKGFIRDPFNALGIANTGVMNSYEYWLVNNKGEVYKVPIKRLDSGIWIIDMGTAYQYIVQQ